MREVIVTSNVSDKIAEHKKAGHTALIFVFLSLLVLVIGVSSNTSILSVGGIFAAIWSAVAFTRSGSNANTYEHGYEGEEMLRRRLHDILPDDYIGYFGFPLKDGKDIDCVLLGPAGLYVFETKHHNGYIQYTDGGWRQVKTGRRGTSYFGNLKNPGGQVLFALREVKSYLENKGMRIFINGVVTFTNPSVELSIEKNPKPLMVCRIDELEKIFEVQKDKMIPLKKLEAIETELSAAIAALRV